MRRIRGLTVLIAALAGGFPLVQADDATTAPAADKSQYTLIHPTPVNLMRSMDTDRPNVTNTPHTVDAGHAQLEAGFVDYSYDHHHVGGGAENADDFAIAPMNLRVGVLNNLEMNIATGGYEIDRSHDAASGTDEAASIGDTVFGGKFNVWGNEGGDDLWSTALAIQPQLKFPTATSDVGNGHFEFSVALPFTINLPADFHLSYQPGVSYERSSGGGGDVPGFQNAVALDHEVLGKLDVYIEYASDVTTQKHVKPDQTLDVGGIYPLTDNITLDLGANFGLNDQTDNLELTTGMSVRY